MPWAFTDANCHSLFEFARAPFPSGCALLERARTQPVPSSTLFFVRRVLQRGFAVELHSWALLQLVRRPMSTGDRQARLTRAHKGQPDIHHARAELHLRVATTCELWLAGHVECAEHEWQL